MGLILIRSSRNLNAIGGPVSKDTFQDAIALEEVIAQVDGWQSWPLTAMDGDCAALIELVMENKAGPGCNAT
jgi:transcription factor C subunit 3